MSDLKRQWNEFQQLSFPAGFAGEKILGICVTSLDSFAAGCLSKCVDGKLDADCRAILKSSLEELNQILPLLDGEALDYFTDLRSLVRSALREAA
jgi:hypothetical protein